MRMLQVKRMSDLCKFTLPRRKIIFKIYVYTHRDTYMHTHIYIYLNSDLRKPVHTHTDKQQANL